VLGQDILFIIKFYKARLAIPMSIEQMLLFRKGNVMNCLCFVTDFSNNRKLVSSEVEDDEGRL